MNILIPTVPHSGTHLLHDMFAQAGFESVPIQKQPTSDSVTTTHIDTPQAFNRVLMLMNDFQAVIPIRHPFLVEESWKRREQPLERMYAAYRRLPALYEAGALFVPVDSPQRDRYVREINKKLNVSLKPDWETVVNGYHNTHKMTHRDVSPTDEARQLERDVSKFLHNFYPEVHMVEEKPPVKKRGRPKKAETKAVPKFIEVIALRKMLNDETGEMAEIGDLVKKTREDAIKLQDVGAIKVPL